MNLVYTDDKHAVLLQTKNKWWQWIQQWKNHKMLFIGWLNYCKITSSNDAIIMNITRNSDRLKRSPLSTNWPMLCLMCQCKWKRQEANLEQYEMNFRHYYTFATLNKTLYIYFLHIKIYDSWKLLCLHLRKSTSIKCV